MPSEHTRLKPIASNATPPFLGSIGFMLTCRCTMACPHCVIHAGPHRTEEMNPDDACNWLDQIADFRDSQPTVIGLTGGEPLLNRAQFRRIASFAEKRGFIVAAVTNAFWAVSETEALSVMRQLSSVHSWSFSTDVYHQITLPIERVRCAVHAAQTCSLPYDISVCTENIDDPDYLKIIAELREFTPPETLRTAITFPSLDGLNGALKKSYAVGKKPPKTICPASGTPVIFPDGRVIACVGPLIPLKQPHPLLLGNAYQSPLCEILDQAQTNPILHALRIWGPAHLIRKCRAAGLDEYLPKQYLRDIVCDGCHRLMSEPHLSAFLTSLTTDPAFLREIAWARLYYFQESTMLERLGITE